jgi:hypothetical protein
MNNFTPMKKIFLCSWLIAASAATGHAQASLNPSFPSNTKICTGSNASFTVSATASGTLTYQWQESTDGGISWNNLIEGSTTGANPANGIYTGTTGPVLTITRAPSTMNGNKYRSNVYVNGANGVSSIAATLNVGPDVSLDNVPAMNCPGTSTTLNTAAATGVSYQWQVSSNSGGSWSNVVNGADPSGVTYSGGATGALTISSLTTAIDGYQYRYTANDGAGCVITSGVTTQRVPALAVFSLPAAGTIMANIGQSTSIPATVTAGTGPFTYQWQVAAGAGAFGNILASNTAYSGVTTSTLSIPSVTSAMYTSRYRVIIKNAGGCAASSTSFAQIGVPVVLPLTITGFTALRQSPSAIKLSWTAGTVTPTVSYTVQRARKGMDFTDIHLVPGEAGKSDYAFLDEGAGNGLLQYRVKAVDGDGTAIYSIVAEVAANGGADELELRPSVVTAGGPVSLYTNLSYDQPLTLKLTDVTGRVLWTAMVRPGKGACSTPLDVSRLSKGIYYVHVSSLSGLAHTMALVRD